MNTTTETETAEVVRAIVRQFSTMPYGGMARFERIDPSSDPMSVLLAINTNLCELKSTLDWVADRNKRVEAELAEHKQAINGLRVLRQLLAD